MGFVINRNVTQRRAFPYLRHDDSLRRVQPMTSQNPRQWASCQIHKIGGAHAPGMRGTFSPSPQVSDPDMHHGTCVTHVP